jgi:hypothetical protein
MTDLNPATRSYPKTQIRYSKATSTLLPLHLGTLGHFASTLQKPEMIDKGKRELWRKVKRKRNTML